MNHQEMLTKQIFTLVDTLWSYGMDEVVISPGSRSTPIAVAAELHPEIKTYIHPDERSAAFFALGLAKGGHTPVGIICTSGTAAANYTPAMAEAELSYIPLVALTADRPHELRDIGAPQSIDQNNMYRNYVKYYTELPLADMHDSGETLIESKIMHCSRYFKGTETGPVHINIPVREPLMPDTSKMEFFYRSRKGLPEYTMVDTSLTELAGTGLVFIGETLKDISNAIGHLDKPGLTIITDPRQHIRKSMRDAVTHHDLIFNAFSAEQLDHIEQEVDFILRIGDPVTSKAANRFLSAAKIPQYVLSEHQSLKTFPVSPETSIIGDVTDTLSHIAFSGGDAGIKEWFKRIEASIGEHIDQNVVDYDDEGRFTYEILQHTDADRTFFLSSSMPIRDVERYDTKNKHSIYANRGANGIDGVVSTAMGMAAKAPLTLIIGDIALYHDMNGLIMSKLENIDINIIVFNNNGGGIFSFLPQYEDKTHFERLFGTPLDLDFKHTAALYDYDYSLVSDVGDISTDLVNRPGRNLIEIRTDREANLNAHQKLRNDIEDMVKSIGY